MSIGSSPHCPSIEPSWLISHFSISPLREFLPPAQDAQSINKTLSPPLGARTQEATQEQAGLSSKAASLVAPRNASSFEKRPNRVGLEMRGGWSGDERGGMGLAGKLDNGNSPIMLICWGNPVKNGRATKGNAFPPLKDRRHFTLQQSNLNPALWVAWSGTHTRFS